MALTNPEQIEWWNDHSPAASPQVRVANRATWTSSGDPLATELIASFPLSAEDFANPATLAKLTVRGMTGAATAQILILVSPPGGDWIMGENLAATAGGEATPSAFLLEVNIGVDPTTGHIASFGAHSLECMGASGPTQRAQLFTADTMQVTFGPPAVVNLVTIAVGAGDMMVFAYDLQYLKG